MNLLQIVTMIEAFLMEACPNTFEIIALQLTEGPVITMQLVNKQFAVMWQNEMLFYKNFTLILSCSIEGEGRNNNVLPCISLKCKVQHE